MEALTEAVQAGHVAEVVDGQRGLGADITQQTLRIARIAKAFRVRADVTNTTRLVLGGLALVLEQLVGTVTQDALHLIARVQKASAKITAL